MSRRKFILLKDSVEFKKGAIVEEECDDGTQEFICITKSLQSSPELEYSFTRKTVLGRPEWWEEIMTVEVPKNHLKKVQDFIKKLK